MIFYYIRHGDPIYSPDSLTPLGHKQADALAKRLSVYGIDKIYCSTSNRAIQTAQPTLDLLKKEAELLDFANENYAGREFGMDNDKGGRTWIFQLAKGRKLLADEAVLSLGHNWYEHPEIDSHTNCKDGIKRIYNEMDNFFENLGYEHMRYQGKYRVKHHSDERIALFAHQGFGLAFLSCLLDIPYPMFCNHFDLGHSSMTVIEFQEISDIAIPRVLTLSSDSHIYKEGLPTAYNNVLRF